MNQIDVNYILDGQVELFDWLFIKKVGIDGDKNYIYLVQDKFRDQRYAKFIIIPDPLRIKQHITQLLIYQNSNDSKLIQPIYDFTVSKDKKMILVTMPVPPRTLYSVIKDSKVDLRVRLFLVQNLANGGVYMHNRRRCIFGQIRPESIVVHEELNVFQRGRVLKKYNSGQPVQLYARLNSFSTLVQTQIKPQKWKWTSQQLQYYDAPEIWSQIDKRKKNQITFHTGQSQKSMQLKPIQNKYTDKSDVWALGLVFIELLSAMRISQLLGDKNIIPGRMLKQITIKQKILRHKAKNNPVNEGQKAQQQTGMTVQQFYSNLCRYIQSLAIKTVIQKMLSLKPEKRPTLEEVLHIVERLQVIDKRNKNMGRMISYKRSLKTLKQSADVKNQPVQNKDQDPNDDKKSVVSMKSVRSGKSSKSHYSQTRKRVPPQYSTLLYARQAISQIHVQTVNPLYRTYFQDCKNRLPSDLNFAPPPKKILMRKQDKAIVLSLKGQNDEDIKNWNIEKVLNDKTPISYESQNMAKVNNPYGPNKNLGVQERGKNNQKRYEAWLHNLRMQGEESKNIQDNANLPKGKIDKLIPNFGPIVKKIPHNSSTIKQYGYNDNLSNYHFLGVENLKQNLITQTCLNRRQCANTVEAPQKSVQFILNLRCKNLSSVPLCLSQYLQPPNCLKYLCLARNFISTLAGLDMAISLRQTLLVLDLSYNCLENINAQLWRFKHLQEAYFIENSITQINGFENYDQDTTDNQDETNPNNQKMVDISQNKQKQNNIQIDHHQINQSQHQIQQQHKVQQNEAKQQRHQNMEAQPIYYEISQSRQFNRQIEESEMNLDSQGNINVRAIQESEVQQYQIEDPRIENQDKDKQIQQLNNKIKSNKIKGVCRSLKKVYLTGNKIKLIENIFAVPCLQILALSKNPLSECMNNMSAIEVLRARNVKIYY